MKKLFTWGLLLSLFITACKQEAGEFGKLTSIVVTPQDLRLHVGATKSLVAQPFPANAGNVSFTWAVENPKIATISPEGWLTALSAGTTRVTVRGGGLEHSVLVTVNHTLLVPVSGTVHTADTIDYSQLSEGVKWLKFSLPDFVNEAGTLGKGLVVNMIEVDLSVKDNKLEVWSALPSRQVNRERPTVVHNRKTIEYGAQGRKPLVVINGDYYLLPATNNSGYAYIDNRPHGMEATNGMLVQTPNVWLNGLVMGGNSKPAHGNVAFSGEVYAANSSFHLSEVNGYSTQGGLVLFNSLASAYATQAPFAWSPYTSTMVSLSQPEGGWRMNGRMTFTVTAVEHGIETAIPAQAPYKGKDFSDQGAVLVGNGAASGNTSQAFLSTLKTGDKIGIRTDVKLNDKIISDPLPNIIGYQAAVLENGIVLNPFNDIHPRTAVGYSRDSSKFYLVVIDGRQANYSVGATTGQAGDILKALGAHFGVNLDGGGSSCMTVNGQITNRPSDGAERAVANGILISVKK